METLIISTRSIFSHKLRSFLTMLGIIIGIGSIICIFSIIQGNTEQLKQQLVGGSTGTLEINYDKKSLFDPSKMTTKEEKKPLYIPEISTQILDKVKKEFHLKNTSVSYKFDKAIYSKQDSAYGQISATTLDHFKMKPIQMIEGRTLDNSDMVKQKQVILISEELRVALSEKIVIRLGDYLEIEGTPFQLIGIFKENEDSAFGNRKVAYVPYNQWSKLTTEINNSPRVLVQTDNINQLQGAATKTAQFLNNEVPDSDYVFGINNFDEYQQNMEKVNQSSFYLLTGIASISLLVGGIGVMNIMLVSITERTKEIGLKKALGARRKTIVVQFLIEAIILTIIGGLIGVILGLVSGMIITILLGYPYVFSLLAVIGSLAFSGFIGILFGIIPAIKASKLNPIQALRF